MQELGEYCLSSTFPQLMVFRYGDRDGGARIAEGGTRK